MSANVETMMYTGATPWHGLGEKVEGDALRNWRETMKRAGLDWTVRHEPLVLKADGRAVSHVAAVRSTDNRILGCVGPGTGILQNEDAFKWFEPWLESGECTFEAAGALAGGSRIWALAKIAHADALVTPDDAVVRYVLLSHAHDNSLAVRAGFTDVRVVCQNTLTAAHDSKASKLIRIKHTTNVVTNLSLVRETMDLAREGFFATMEQFKALASKEISKRDVERYVQVLLTGKPFPVEPDKLKEIATRTKNRVDTIVNLAFTGAGNDGSTMWDAFNGVTEYTSWQRGRSDESRVNSLWFGDAAKLNDEALKLALDFEPLPALAN